MSILAARCGTAEAPLVCYFKPLKNRLTIDICMMLCTGGLKIAGREYTDFIGPVRYAGGALRRPPFKAGFGLDLPVGFFAFCIGFFQIGNRYTSRAFHRHGF